MPFIGNKPSAVPLTSADIADGIITSAKIVDGTIVNADINASSAIALSKLSTTGTADATTFLRGDGAYTAVSSDYVLLATTNITSSTASVSFDGYFSSTYKNYKVMFSNFVPVNSGGVSLEMRFRRSNADITTSNYYWVNNASRFSDGGSFATDPNYNYSADYFLLTGGVSINNAAYSGNGEVALFDPLGTTNYKWFQSSSNWIYNNGTQYLYDGYGSGYLRDNANALSGITIFGASGNIANGNFKLYGIK
jgi:hypothetical protein